MAQKETAKKSNMEDGKASNSKKDGDKQSANAQLDVGQDIRQNSGNNDSTNAMVTGDKNSYR